MAQTWAKHTKIPLKDVWEPLSSVRSNYHPYIWVTATNYNYKSHKYKILHQLIKAQRVKQRLMCCWCETVAQLHEHYVFTSSKIKIGDVAGGILMQAGSVPLSHTLFLCLTLSHMLTDWRFTINTPFYWQVVSGRHFGQKHFPNVLRISTWRDSVVKNGTCCHVTTGTRKLSLLFSQKCTALINSFLATHSQVVLKWLICYLVIWLLENCSKTILAIN